MWKFKQKNMCNPVISKQEIILYQTSINDTLQFNETSDLYSPDTCICTTKSNDYMDNNGVYTSYWSEKLLEIPFARCVSNNDINHSNHKSNRYYSLIMQ